jgi:HEAT repeat protein
MFAPSPLPRTLEASFRDLRSTSYATRASAVRDVVRHALAEDAVRTRALPLLEQALSSDLSSAVRAAAALALADLAAHEALATLLVAVEDDDPRVRQMALTALGEIGDARARPRLERALHDRRPEVRYQAIIAFARVASGDGAAVAEALAAALDDTDAEIRYIAVRLAEEHRIEGPIASRAHALLDAKDDALAVAAALYVARLGDTRGRSAILDIVAGRRRTPVLEDEQASVELAGELDLREAIPDLERRTWGGRHLLRRVMGWGAGAAVAGCSWHARIALAKMGHERARSEILADLSSWRRETREAAVVAAARSGLSPAAAG